MAKKVLNLIVGIFADIFGGMYVCHQKKNAFWFRMLVWLVSTIMTMAVLDMSALVQANWVTQVVGLFLGFMWVGFFIPTSLFRTSDIISKTPH